MSIDKGLVWKYNLLQLITQAPIEPSIYS